MTAISQIRTPSALSLSDLNTTINHEPRIRDIALAERLGFTTPVTIRKLIERNRAELETYGILSTVEKNTDGQRGRPGKEYYLNEGQALVICALSRTANAAAVRHALITVYMEYRRGQLGAPALPPPSAEPPFCTGCAARRQWDQGGISPWPTVHSPATSWRSSSTGAPNCGGPKPPSASRWSPRPAPPCAPF